MASLVFTDAYVSINSVDLSDHVLSVSIPYAAEMIDETAMGDGTRKNLGGLKTWSVDVEFKQDYAASKVDATLFSIVGTAVPIVIRPVKSTVVGATNPNYTGTGVLESYTPIGGGVGELLKTSVTFQSAGTLTRATA